MMHETAQYLLARWAKTMERFGYPASAAGLNLRTFEKTLTAYQDPARVYHSEEHLKFCFKIYDELYPEVVLPETELALWLHDFEYGLAPSARAVSWVRLLGLGKAEKARVAAAIMATSHQQPPQDRGQAIVLDCDLAILGQNHKEYDAYELKVRQEYSTVSDQEFYPARAKILGQFLARPAIYYTPEAYQTYEIQAKYNLIRTLVRYYSEGLIPAGLVPKRCGTCVEFDPTLNSGRGGCGLNGIESGTGRCEVWCATIEGPLAYRDATKCEQHVAATESDMRTRDYIAILNGSPAGL
jgi:predicted metal-dependent HD superfamily phosphohydrolase